MTAADPLLVEIDIALRHAGHPAPAVLRWHPCDPWAVQLDFTACGVRWLFGWQLLDDLLTHGSAGDGDVMLLRVSPQTVAVGLSAPTGGALLAADPSGLAAFAAAVRPRHAVEVAGLRIPDTVPGLLAVPGQETP